jgi:hypothetical protein
MQPLRGVCYETGPRNATSCMSAFCRGAAWPFKGKPGFVVFFYDTRRQCGWVSCSITRTGTIDKPNTSTPYKDIFQELQAKDPRLYAQS